MKKQISITLATGCLLALMIAVPAHAQMPGSTMRVTIPFDFIVRGKPLPAGDYQMVRINDSPEGLIIRNVNDKRDHVVFQTESVEPKRIPKRNELVFHRYGDSYFLSEVLTAGEQTGREVAPTRLERQLRHQMASNKTEPQEVAVAVY